MMVCEGCGCTEDHACVTAHGPCHWVSTEPPICSACVDDVVDVDRCPATKHGVHSALYRADGSAYCVSCRAELDVSEAA